MSEQDIDPVKTGRLIYKLRKKRQMTQQELGDAVYVTRKAVSKWETGNGCPSIDTLKRLANFFEISLEELIAGDCLATRIAAQRRFILKVIKNKWFKIIGGSILALVLLLIIIFLLFFRSNDKIYLLNYEDDNITMVNTIIYLGDKSTLTIGKIYSDIDNVDDSIEYKYILSYKSSEGDCTNIAEFNSDVTVNLDKETSKYLRKELSRKKHGIFYLNVKFTDLKDCNYEYNLELNLTEGNKDDLINPNESISIDDGKLNEEDIIDLNFLFEMDSDRLSKCFSNKKTKINNERYDFAYNSETLTLKIIFSSNIIFISMKDRRVAFRANSYKVLSLDSSLIINRYNLETEEFNLLKRITQKLKSLCLE